jgi:DNA polymerase-1
VRQLEYQKYTVGVADGLADLEEVRSWLQQQEFVGLDTETTGLDTYAVGHRLRTVQFGNGTQAYVIPYQAGYRSLIWDLLLIPDVLIMHNAPFDTQVLAKHIGIELPSLWDRAVDTKILTKLVDSRGPKEGVGHDLEHVIARFVSEEIAEDIKGLVRRECVRLHMSRAQYFKEVPIDDENYLLYAGMDPILNYLLYQKVDPLVPLESRHLIRMEHELEELTTEVSHRGWLLDYNFTTKISGEFEDMREAMDKVAWRWYLDNVNSPQQVIQALGYAGLELDGRTTPNGQPKVDDKALSSMDHPLATAIINSKRATKWQHGYCDNFLSNMDADGRVHPVINTMAARTARFSVQNPALQTCPPGVKGCLLAEEGEVTVALDYNSQELRIGAALSGDRRMIEAFSKGLDLHQITADAAGVSRDIGKMGNYLIVYGGGWRALVEQAGIDEETARRVIHATKVSYPDLEAFGRYCASEARSRGYITTSSGRRLYVDRDRGYSAINYRLQSDARDMTVGGMLKLNQYEREHLRMAVHDELLFSFRATSAEKAAQRVAAKMAGHKNGVDFPVEIKIGSQSWGSLYEKA